MQILAKLFGTPARVKIMRLFLLNSDQGFERKDVALRSKTPSSNSSREVTFLLGIGFIKKCSFTKEEVKKTKNGEQIKKKKVTGFILNPNFQYLTALRSILLDTEFLKKEDLASRFRVAGKIKLLITSGVFIREDDSSLDLLIVGDNLKNSIIEKTVRLIESEIGKELTYAIFDTKDFLYRLSMYDKLVRDVLDYPHEKVIDTMGSGILAHKM